MQRLLKYRLQRLRGAALLPVRGTSPNFLLPEQDTARNHGYVLPPLVKVRELRRHSVDITLYLHASAANSRKTRNAVKLTDSFTSRPFQAATNTTP